VTELAGDRGVAAGTLSIPHPYPRSAAEEWISAQGAADNPEQTFAVTRKADGQLVGAIGLRIEREHERAELGYWIGRPFWGNGYATEAGRAVVAYGFDELRLNRIYAYHFANNPASGAVLRKLGLTHEGVRRQHTAKWGELLDNEAYGILRSEYTGGTR
jgi:RimJ/RimL family protein N-acetyltransferase